MTQPQSPAQPRARAACVLSMLDRIAFASAVGSVKRREDDVSRPNAKQRPLALSLRRVDCVSVASLAWPR